MPVNFRIPNHMIIPFGCPKWDISKISLVSVSTDGTYFTSETKCAYIDRSKNEPLRLFRFKELLPDVNSNFPTIDHPVEAVKFMCAYLTENCDLQTTYERKFLRFYFNYVIDRLCWWWSLSLDPDENSTGSLGSTHWLFASLLPLPQAHIYARDPFHEGNQYNPDRMFKVDFAFWTGNQLVAIEIDGGSHIGNTEHVTKDRMLSRAGVQVVHILNDELDEHRERVITSLLPVEIYHPWETDEWGFPIGDPPPMILNPLEEESIPY